MVLQQLALFPPQKKIKEDFLMATIQEWDLFVDGASRNNPGLAGAGILLITNQSVIVQKGYFLGTLTNNQAEYAAIIIGIIYFKRSASLSDKLSIFSDSQLVVNQIKGVYKIKDETLKKLHKKVMVLLEGISYTVAHILRDKNKEADKLANDGIDKRILLPSDIQNVVQFSFDE